MGSRLSDRKQISRECKNSTANGSELVQPGTAKRPQRIGRPPLSDAARRGKTVRVLITKGEHEELRQAAAVARVSLSSWVGCVALARAREIRAVPKVGRSPNVVHLQLEPIGTPGEMCHASCDAMIDDPPSQLAVDVMFVTCPHCREMDFMTAVNVDALRQAMSGGSNGK